MAAIDDRSAGFEPEDLTPRRRRYLLGVLLFAIALNLLVRVFEGTLPLLMGSALSLISVLLASATVVALIAFAVGRNWLTWLMVGAGVSFVSAQFLLITESIPALRDVPIVGSKGAYHRFAFGLLDFTGLSLWIVGFFATVFELHRVRTALAQERRKLEVETRQRTESTQALAESEERYRRIVEDATDIIFQTDPTGRVTYANAMALEFSGYAQDEFIGKHVLDCVSPDARESVAEQIKWQVRKKIESTYMEFPATTKDGATVWIGQNVSLLLVRGGVIGLQGVARDITERKAAEMALRTSEERFRRLVEATGVVPWEADAETFVCTYIGPQAEATLGYLPEAWTEPGFWASVLHPEDRDGTLEYCRARIQEGCDFEMSYRMLSAAGDVRWFRSLVTVVSENGSPSLLRGILVDITDIQEAEEERSRFEAQLQNAQKLESLGVLAGGIAHDFNNLLAGIMGNADLALHFPDQARENLRTIVATAGRAGELCQQLLAYSGRGKFVVEPHDLSALVREMGELLELPVSKRARIQYELAADLPTVEGDATQIRQVVLNLITNATESLEDVSGVISVRTGVVDLDDAAGEDATLHGEFTPGSHAYLEVADTGCGMDPDTQARMFDPFYTTKFSGRGLGLAAVLGIMRGHRGAIRVRSKPGGGTAIRLYFPVSGRPVPIAISGDNGNGHWRGEGAILVVDDEAVIRKFVSTVLHERGFEVVTAVDGLEAVREFRKRTNDFVAIVLDLTMPNMDGAEAYREMCGIREGVPVVVISGFSEADVARSFADSSVSAFLQKPFKSDELLAAVKEAVAVYG